MWLLEAVSMDKILDYRKLETVLTFQELQESSLSKI